MGTSAQRQEFTVVYHVSPALLSPDVQKAASTTFAKILLTFPCFSLLFVAFPHSLHRYFFDDGGDAILFQEIVKKAWGILTNPT
jgi:hypothetical protein